MKDDLRAMPNGPSNGLGIAPSLVADHHAERQRTHREHSALRAGRVDRILRRVDLHLVLKARDRAVRVHDQRGRHGRASHDALGAEYDRDARAPRGIGDGGPGGVEKHRVGSRHTFALCPISGDVALGKADHPCSALTGPGDGLRRTLHRVIASGRKTKVRESNPEHCHARNMTHRYRSVTPFDLSM